jgi:hypothetical protein
VTLEEAQAVLAALALMASERKGNAAFAPLRTFSACEGRTEGAGLGPANEAGDKNGGCNA